MTEFSIPAPPEKLFKTAPMAVEEMPGVIRYLDTSKGDQGRVFPEEGGTETWFIGYKYPFPGYIWPRMVELVRLAKRAPAAIIRFCASSPARYFMVMTGLILFFLPKSILNKIIIRALDMLADIFGTAFDRYDFDFNKFCKSGREIYRVGSLAAEKYWKKGRLIRGICIIWEFDDVYRWRGQDGLGEISQEELKKNPIKEVERLFNRLIEREWAGQKGDVARNWRVIKFGVLLLMKINKPFREKVLFILQNLDLEKIKLAEQDLYFCLEKYHYNFKNLNYLKRLEIRKYMDN